MVVVCVVVVGARVEGGVQHAGEGRGEAVPEGDEGGAELGLADAAGVVLVEAFEEGAPGGQEAPEVLEFGVGYGLVGRVGGGGEEAGHGADGEGVEGRVVCVDEGGREFGGRQGACAAGVGGEEEWVEV